MTWLSLLTGRHASNPLPDLQAAVARVGELEAHLLGLSNSALLGKFQTLKEKVSQGEALDSVMESAFALVREAARRAAGKRLYDVQVLAGLALARGQIAEMATGEGKTLSVVAPAAWMALSGRGVHVATVNAYLAARDHNLMAPIYQFLGLTVGGLPEKPDPAAKHAAYRCDVTYGTGYEFGFDYLRDQLLLLGNPEEKLGVAVQRQFLNQPEPSLRLAQRGTVYAIVDEIDSVLIDEALTPLVLSQTGGGPHRHPHLFHEARQHADQLTAEDYELRPSDRQVHLTKSGLSKLYRGHLGNPPSPLKRAWHEYVLQALRATHLYHRDVHYLVREEAIEIIDEFTGRSFKDRKWQEGLHQAIEAKEGIEISDETAAEVSISRQVFYQLYERVGGLTGTAQESAQELQRVYHLPVVPIPLHRPNQRILLPDRIFSTCRAKNLAILGDIKARHVSGQPILVGTRTVQRSEELVDLLQQHGLPVEVLNARQDAREAELIAQAGKLGAITIATNMAGRGADIHLGPGVTGVGGLHVIGQERNESRRVDRQLYGRAARQGDPGSAQFFLSLEDDLLSRNQPELAARLLKEAGLQEELPVAAVEPFLQAQQHLAIKLQSIREQLMLQDKFLNKIKRHL